MPDYPDQLHAASFRGIPFEVESTSGTFGRRGPLHEYPLRDKPYKQDMGRAARHLTIDAFVLGDDYLARRDDLIEALETAGPGLLVHPSMGPMTVFAEPAEVVETKEEGGMARIRFSFVEAGELTFPTGTIVAATEALDAGIAGWLAAAADLIASLDLAGAVWLVTDAIETVTDIVDDLARLLTPSPALLLALDQMEAGVADLLAAPETLAAAVEDLFELVERVEDLFAFTSTAPATETPTTTRPTAIAQARNREALHRLFHRGALVRAGQLLLDAEFTAQDEAEDAAEDYAARLQTEADATTDRDVWDALTRLRGAVVRDVTSRAVDLPRLRTVTLPGPSPTPAIVLAWDLYADASRASEIVDRNRVAHPGFLPRSVEVLAS